MNFTIWGLLLDKVKISVLLENLLRFYKLYGFSMISGGGEV